MAKKSKRFLAAVELVDENKLYSLQEGVDLIKKTGTAKFDETVEIAVRLGVDPRHADQVVRGTVSLPHGLGKEVRVMVIAKGDKATEATEAGADHVGYEDYLEKISGGWLDFDVLVATPDAMRDLGKLGRVLGPRGLMPNPKSGTVTMDIGTTVKEVKAGKIDFRVDKHGIIHTSVGKASFDADKLEDNVRLLVQTIFRLKPSASKGTYVKSIALSNVMGPGIRLTTSSSDFA
ncbi:MAG: 50S ribosomal protein L1 [Calditrichia bacterium]